MELHDLVAWLGGSAMSATVPAAPCISHSSGSNPYTWLPQVLAGFYVLLFGLGLVAILLGRRASFALTGRRLILWSFVLASFLSLLGIAWGWQLSSTYNDGGCVVYVQSAPFDESSIALVISILLLGTLVVSAAYLLLDIFFVIRILRSRQTKA
ncbi:MAG: hypothetical protein ACLQUY_04095 [Ktedonobacterales bacterium]